MRLKPIGANVAELELTTRISGNFPILVLFSYSTPVAMRDSTGSYARTAKRWSNTTSRHINAWLGGYPARTEPQAFFDTLAERGKAMSVPDTSVFFLSDVRRDVVAHLTDYLTLQAQIWPTVLEGKDPVYNRAKALLDTLTLKGDR